MEVSITKMHSKHHCRHRSAGLPGGRNEMLALFLAGKKKYVNTMKCARLARVAALHSQASQSHLSYQRTGSWSASSQNR